MSYEPIVLRRASARLRARRERRAWAREQLQRQLNERCPDLPRLDAALRGTMAELAELALSGDPERAAREVVELKERNLALQRQRKELLEAAGHHVEELEDVPECPKCGDTGWVGTQMCQCLKDLCAQEQIQQLSSLLDLGEMSFDKVRLDVYSDQPWNGKRRTPRQNMANVIRMCKGYACQFPHYPVKDLLFSGNTGLGKTYLSACIARVVSESGHSVVYDTAINVFSRFDARKFARDAEQEQEARDDTRRYLNCDLLILDDLGSELTTPLVRAALYELVNSRLGGGYRTIISTNLPMEEIRERYTPQIASRLEGMYQELTFFGEDIRLQGR